MQLEVFIAYLNKETTLKIEGHFRFRHMILPNFGVFLQA